ncbi:DUF397 domain-containing protein [Streptomyces huiliensis]|uniref:DUF397 domain-containing protein n=1 Tax=Streptomyces huiliensis TaxID=2876027 RepID=UPI001CBF24B6|nr:DUF397 domain-containing protein [Streptomyces huiliensis]MBZ4319555.1 DUF397 domain-containing protein [Streptomyces huiliensis]
MTINTHLSAYAENTLWFASSYSNGGGNCVEWAPAFAASGTIPVRDSKRPTGPVLHVSTGAFAGLVTAIKHGGFTP